MSPAAIPNWNSQGVLPPINPASPTSVDRSPYSVTLTDLVSHFGTTSRRQTILLGLLAFRSALHSAGLTEGFQWVDGSFLENIEMIESRDPDDVDVVTFYHLPTELTQQELAQANPRLFDRTHTKTDHYIDAYFEQLNQRKPELLVRKSTYWYSMWAHRRNNLWKGYLQVNLDSAEEEIAKASLEAMTKNGGAS